MAIKTFSDRDDILGKFQTVGGVMIIDSAIQVANKIDVIGNGEINALKIDGTNELTTAGKINVLSKTDANNNIVLENGELTVSGQITARNVVFTSDMLHKGNISEISPSNVEGLRNLRAKEYRFKEGDGRLQFGYIAQDVEKIYPSMVVNVNGVKRVDYVSMIPLLLEKINTLEKKVSALTSEL